MSTREAGKVKKYKFYYTIQLMKYKYNTFNDQCKFAAFITRDFHTNYPMYDVQKTTVTATSQNIHNVQKTSLRHP